MGDRKKPGNLLLIKLYALKRKMFWLFFARHYGAYLVAEYPKSGGTWYSQMLADYLGLPFSRNTSRPSYGICVMHGHELYKGYDERVSVVLRDGRDVMVSFYYHHLFYNEWNHHPSVDKHRAYLGFSDVEDLRGNLPAFIEYMNTVWGKRFNHFTWSDFVHSWLDHMPEERIVRYEDLLADPVGTMSRVLKSLGHESLDVQRLEDIVDKYSFEKLSGRKSGTEDKRSFVRKGVAGDWVNHYSPDAKKVFDHFCGDALIRCGYEADHSWVTE